MTGAAAGCEGCGWYHGLWPALRALDLVTTPADHADFLVAGLVDAFRAGGARDVLVSGSADFATLEVVARAAAAAGAAPETTVVDLCETPLAVNRARARELGIRVRTVRSDVLDFAPAAPFDVVVTHSFLGYFAGPDRERLVRRWAEMLRPGGRVLTVHRVRPPDSPTLVRFTPAEAAAFRERVRDAAERRADPALDPEALGAAAAVYAERFAIHAVRSDEELRAPFVAAGLRVEAAALPGVRRTAGPATGPTVPGRARYVGVCAQKPAGARASW